MTHNVRNYGAIGDGKSLDTAAVQRALDACGAGGGGTVLFPPGRYLSGSLILHSRSELHLEEGATLLQSSEMGHYVVPPPTCYVYSTASRYVFVYGNRLEHIAITGQGCIDGQLALDCTGHSSRRGPLTILIENSKDIVMRDVTVRNSPGWSTTFWGCRDIELIRVKCLDGYADGINPSCCRNVHYRDCLIEGSGDDPLSIKNEPAGAERYGGKYEDRPDCGFLTENILIENTTIRGTTHACLKLGTAMFGVMCNITFRDCTFENTGAVLSLQLMQPAFKQNPLRRVENITFENIVAKDPREFIDITSIDAVGPVIRNIEFRNVEVSGVRNPANIWGLPDAPVRNILFDNVRISGRASPRGLRARWVEGLTVRHSTFDMADADCGFLFEESRDIELDHVTVAGHHGADPLIELRDVDGFRIRGSRIPDVRTFLRVAGAGTAGIELEHTDLRAAKTPFQFDSDVPAGAVACAAAVGTTDLRPPGEIPAGREIPVSVGLRNDGEAGLHKAAVAMKGETVAAKWCYLEAGESADVELVASPRYVPGEYLLSAGGQAASVRVVPTPAAFAYGERMEIVSPAAAGALTVVRVPVKNVGGEPGRTRMELKADDQVAASEEVFLAPGEERVVVIGHRFPQAGPRRLRVGDFPEWPFATFANTNARFWQTREKILIEAGGGRHDIRDCDREHAAVYLPVEGDFEAEARYRIHLVTGPYAGGGILVKNDMTRPEEDSGCVLGWRYPKYDIPTFVNPVQARVVRRGKEFEGSHLVSPDTAAECVHVGLFATAFSGKGERITIEFEGFELRRKS